jgi:hypothetical protein
VTRLLTEDGLIVGISADLRQLEQVSGAAQVPLHHDAQVADREQGPAMGDHDPGRSLRRPPAPRVDLPRDLVHGTLGGQTHTDVQELADTGLGRQEPNDPAQEPPVLPFLPTAASLSHAAQDIRAAMRRRPKADRASRSR